MNLTQLEMHGVQYARERRFEADTARLFAQAPRRPRHTFRFVARAMRGLARRLATAAERMDPAPAERAPSLDAAWHPTRHAA